MPTLTLTFSYDGKDSEVMQALSRMAAAFEGNGKVNVAVNGGSSWAQRVAQNFAGHVSHAAARGDVSQQEVVCAWLKRDGTAPLNDLVKASGVAKTHDFAGVSSSLTRNMLKAGGPRKWYEKQRDASGKRVYRISDELVVPLKRAFQI